ncbi:hypothetical protein M569_15189, partial [Genlisea aurea]
LRCASSCSWFLYISLAVRWRRRRRRNGDRLSAAPDPDNKPRRSLQLSPNEDSEVRKRDHLFLQKENSLFE